MSWMTKTSGTRVDDAEPSGGKSMKPGGGGRFNALVSKLSTEPGVRNPQALAAFEGRKKWGTKRMSGWANKGK